VTQTDYEALWNADRPFLWGYCYRLTGSAADADDTVQETFMRALERPPEDTSRPWRPWLVRVATNLVRDRWRSGRRWVGPWLPGPIETAGENAVDWAAGVPESADVRYEALESVSAAFLLALEALTPLQRAVLLLRDVYDESTAETAEHLGITEANVKTTLHRARHALQDYDRERTPPSAALARRHARALERLLAAFRAGDVAAMGALLADDVRATSDGNGRFYAAKKPVVGRDKVLRFFQAVFAESTVPPTIEIRELNGLPAALIERRDLGDKFAPRFVFRMHLGADDRIVATESVLVPEKLMGLRGLGGTR